jgi:ubiquinol-cytochrome c reductase iron-sulfur subunit
VASRESGYSRYALYTPIVGFALSVLAAEIGVFAYAEKFLPDEVARLTVTAQLVKAGKDTDIARRKLIVRAAGRGGYAEPGAGHRGRRPAGA